MARNITISTIAPAPLDFDPQSSDDQIIKQMIDHWQSQLDQVLPDEPDLIVIPEVCDQPGNFTLDRCRTFYQARADRIGDFFAQVARDHHCYITYPCEHQLPDQSWRNAVFLLDRQGHVAGLYHKNFLMPLENSERGILYGKKPAVIQCDFGTVGMVVCFDLNFTELLEQYAKAQPDLLLFPSMYHGGLMQPYWAYACRAHLVAAVAGIEANIISPLGAILAHSTEYRNYATARVNLDCKVAHYDFHLEKLTALKKQMGKDITITDPGHLASVLITSQTPDLTIDEILEEFNIQPLDQYLTQTRAQRNQPNNIEP